MCEVHIQQKYARRICPVCNIDEQINSEYSFLNIIGDDKCQFFLGKGTNTIESGLRDHK